MLSQEGGNPTPERRAVHEAGPPDVLHRGPRRLGALALALVLLSLVASLVAPVLLQRRIDRLRAEVDERADPARTLVTGIQYGLARQMSALRGYLLAGDPRFLETYAEASAAEGAAYRRLEPLARGLGGEVLERFVELHTLTRQWHQEVTAEEVASVRGRGSAPALVEQELYEGALRAARELDAAIARATRLRAAEVRAVERQRMAVTAALVLLALTSSLVVARLGRQMDRLALEAERQRARAVRALAASQSTQESRYRLMRGVTHDVKNPLGAADGYAELLRMELYGPLAARQAHAVERIRGCIADALGIIGDLLELSRAESGTLPVERRGTELGALLRGLVDEYAATAAAAGRTLHADVAGPVYAHTDPARVRQVVGNLISNAIKYAHGSECVALSAEPAPPGARPGDWVVVRVADRGPGIPAGEIERLFEEFYRAPGAQADGHGLGLPVSRRIAHLLGGELTAESEVGRGSVFTLWLPAEARRAE